MVGQANSGQSRDFQSQLVAGRVAATLVDPRDNRTTTYGNWFSSAHQWLRFRCRWMSSTVSHSIVLFDGLLSVAVSNYQMFRKMLPS